MDVRRATETDIEGIAAARHSNGPAHDDSGADARYCRYLIDDGHLVVAVDEGDLVGFGGAVDVGDARLLSDLYVHRAAHGRGVGKAMLAAVMHDAPARFTFASNDPAALPLYARAGMLAWWPLLSMHGHLAVPASSECTAFDVSVHHAAEYEQVASGIDREHTYRYWAARHGSRTMAVERGGRRIAVAAVRTTDGAARVEHLVADDDDTIHALGAIGALVSAETLHVYVPGCRAAAVELMERGFAVTDTSLFMASSIDLVHPHVQVVHPGLC